MNAHDHYSPTDFAPKATRLAIHCLNGKCRYPTTCETAGACWVGTIEHSRDGGPFAGLAEFEAEMKAMGAERLGTTNNPLDAIAALIASLTYGEMMELAEKLWQERPGDTEITKETLPGMWHRWSNPARQP